MSSIFQCETIDWWMKQLQLSKSWTFCHRLSMRCWKYLDYFSLLEPTGAWRLSWETAQLMYSWCMNCEWCTARQLLYCTYLRSLVYAWTYIYGTSKIRLSLRKIQFHTVDVIIRNVAIQGIFSLDLASFWCRIVSIVDSLCNNHQRSLLDLRQLLPGHLLRQPRTTTPVSLMKKNAFVTPSSYSLDEFGLSRQPQCEWAFCVWI